MNESEITIPRVETRHKFQISGKHLALFWKKVDKTEACWIWNGARHHRGNYGMVKINRRMKIASRISLQISIGALGPDECALHRCDNPPCVNPDHLFAGTPYENIKDKIKKGRANYAKGEAHWTRRRPDLIKLKSTPDRSEISEQTVRSIREAWISGGLTQGQVARIFGVTQGRTHAIIARKTFKDIFP